MSADRDSPTWLVRAWHLTVESTEEQRNWTLVHSQTSLQEMWLLKSHWHWFSSKSSLSSSVQKGGDSAESLKGTNKSLKPAWSCWLVCGLFLLACAAGIFGRFKFYNTFSTTLFIISVSVSSLSSGFSQDHLSRLLATDLTHRGVGDLEFHAVKQFTSHWRDRNLWIHSFCVKRSFYFLATNNILGTWRSFHWRVFSDIC